MPVTALRPLSVNLTCLTVLVVLVLLTLVIPAARGEERPLPRKIANIRLGSGLKVVEGGGGRALCSNGAELIGQVGLQVAKFPWSAEAVFSTNVGIEFFAGLFYPSWRLAGGWLAVSVGPVFKVSTEQISARPDLTCSETVKKSVQGYGLGAGVEYLLFDGYLGFFLDGRKTFGDLPAMTVSTGITVSPLLWLLYRNQ